MFEIYINTLYFALRIAEFLDPENVYFKLRIFAYEDYGKDKKSLDLVLKQESLFIVLDDIKEVWKKHKLSLNHVQKYVYFDSRDKTIVLSLFSLKTDEDETTGELTTILKKLQLIHSLFFIPKSEDGLTYRDVRYILVRLIVLQGCNGRGVRRYLF